MRYDNPPFPLGTTYFGGDTNLIETVDSAYWEGVEFEFNDNDATVAQGVEPSNTNTVRRMRIVRNTSGGALLAKRVAKLDTGASTAKGYLGGVSGYATDATVKGYPIDEAVVSVADDDLFYVCVRGRAKVTTAAAGDTNISIGKYVVASTDGKVVEQDRTELDADLYDQIQNRVGRILQAVNATNTDVDVWVDD